MSSKVIYLDNHATTPCDPRVVEAMLPYFGVSFGNPASGLHRIGRDAAESVEIARDQIASLAGAHAREIIFTSGATESNNLAILGLARGAENTRKRIVTSAIEHKAVLLPCNELLKEGFDVVVLSVDTTGMVSLDAARKEITADTLLVSIQAANNEVGTIQHIAELARIAHDRGALFHCDGAQALGKISIDVVEQGIDLLSVSAHKLYGPKGVGALCVSGGTNALPIRPLAYGGGQEDNLRPGTLNVSGIVGFGKACELCVQLMDGEAIRIGRLRDSLEAKLAEVNIGIRRNGAMQRRLPGNSSLTFSGLDAEAIIANTPSLALSTGSACTSGAIDPSHVLLAIGLSRQDAYSTIRIGLGRFSTEAEVVEAAETLNAAIERVRKLSR